MNLLFNVGAVVVLLGGLIFVHELGHFLAARLCGMRVERVSRPSSDPALAARLAAWRAAQTEGVPDEPA